MANSKHRRFDWENLAAQAGHSVRKLSELSGLRSWQLRRECHRLFGCSPRSLLGDRRMKAAGALLVKEDRVKQAATEAGYIHSSSFCRWFKAHSHSTPAQFRSSLSGPGASGTESDGAGI
jgi:AraC-like DNA-binding protein